MFDTPPGSEGRHEEPDLEDPGDEESGVVGHADGFLEDVRCVVRNWSTSAPSLTSIECTGEDHSSTRANSVVLEEI